MDLGSVGSGGGGGGEGRADKCGHGGSGRQRRGPMIAQRNVESSGTKWEQECAESSAHREQRYTKWYEK